MLEQNRTERIEWLDFGKGFTILLVVLGHVLLGLLESKRFENYNDLLLFLVQVLYLFHIPVFFALSGFFFKPLNSIMAYVKYVKSKTLALAVPYVFYSIIQYTLQKIGGSTVRAAATFTDLLSIYKTPLGVSWYLYVLWWIFIVIGLFSLWIKDKKYLGSLSIFAFLVALFFPVDNYIVQKLLFWSVFFVAGYVLRNSFTLGWMTEHWKLISVISLIIISIFMIVWWNSNPNFYISYDRPRLWGIIFLLSIALAFSIYPILSSTKRGGYFVKVGKDSLIIYLLHAPIVSVTRIALLKLGVDSIIFHIIFGLLAGWFGSLVALYIFKKIPYLDFVFYPTKYIKLKK